MDNIRYHVPSINLDFIMGGEVYFYITYLCNNIVSCVLNKDEVSAEVRCYIYINTNVINVDRLIWEENIQLFTLEIVLQERIVVNISDYNRFRYCILVINKVNNHLLLNHIRLVVSSVRYFMAVYRGTHLENRLIVINLKNWKQRVKIIFRFNYINIDDFLN